MPSPCLILSLLLAICFTLSTWLQPCALEWNRSRAQTDNLLALTLGDARRMFANHFFVKADVYFHSGYYPTIFDQARTNQTHIAEQAGQDKHDELADEKEADFLGPPRDWIEKIGRKFFVTEHTHLEGGNEHEILPWMRLAAELDPQQVETYTVAAYWLRNNLHKPKEAEQFLREGLRANPDSYEILFEIGQLYDENFQDAAHGRNVWELALRKWEQTEGHKSEPDPTICRKILTHLARSEEKSGNWGKAIGYLTRLKNISPHPDEVQKQINELRQKSVSPAGTKIE